MQNNHVLLYSYFVTLSLAQVYLIESAGSPATAAGLVLVPPPAQQGRKAALAIEELGTKKVGNNTSGETPSFLSPCVLLVLHFDPQISASQRQSCSGDEASSLPWDYGPESP